MMATPPSAPPAPPAAPAATATQIFSSSGTPPNLTAARIDFGKADLPEYAPSYALLIDHAFSPRECAALLAAAEASRFSSSASGGSGWEKALVNVGGGRQRLMPEVRDCGRIIWDDEDVVAGIWERVKACVEEDIGRLVGRERGGVMGQGPGKRGEVWGVRGLNERMRVLRYQGGEYFREHCDGTYVTPDGKEMSFFTLHLYLNEADQGNQLEGGATVFWSINMKRKFEVEPRVGRVLVFQHRGLLHSGDDVRGGVKYTLRTDLMYRKVSSGEK